MQTSKVSFRPVWQHIVESLIHTVPSRTERIVVATWVLYCSNWVKRLCSHWLTPLKEINCCSVISVLWLRNICTLLQNGEWYSGHFMNPLCPWGLSTPRDTIYSYFCADTSRCQYLFPNTSFQKVANSTKTCHLYIQALSSTTIYFIRPCPCHLFCCNSEKWLVYCHNWNLFWVGMGCCLLY